MPREYSRELGNISESTNAHTAGDSILGARRPETRAVFIVNSCVRTHFLALRNSAEQAGFKGNQFYGKAVVISRRNRAMCRDHQFSGRGGMIGPGRARVSRAAPQSGEEIRFERGDFGRNPVVMIGRDDPHDRCIRVMGRCRCAGKSAAPGTNRECRGRRGTDLQEFEVDPYDRVVDESAGRFQTNQGIGGGDRVLQKGLSGIRGGD
jgi:hypothetical protein